MLSDLLVINVFHFLLVFARLGVVFLLMPGISAGYIPVRIRLILALLVTLLTLPLVQQYLPEQPESSGLLVKLIFLEMMVGAFIGAIQTVMAALDLAGLKISQAVGLMNAFVDDPVSDTQSAIIIGFLNMIVVILIFSTGLHALMIMAIVDSYTLMMPNDPLMTGDMLNMLASALTEAFHVGTRLASPFLVYSLVFQVTMVIMSRLSPQMNVFFVALPIQLLLGFALLTIALPAIMMTFLHYFESNLISLLLPGVNGV